MANFTHRKTYCAVIQLYRVAGYSITLELTNEVDQHVPLSTIIGWIGEKELDETSVHWLLPLCSLHIGLEKVVATLNLWKRKQAQQKNTLGK